MPYNTDLVLMILQKRNVREELSWSPQKKKQEVELKASMLPPRSPVVGLKVVGASSAVVCRGRAWVRDSFYNPDWFISQEDTYSDLAKAREIRRGCVTPQD